MLDNEMTLVIPFCSKDALATKRLLQWIGDLGGCKGHNLLLVADADTPLDLCLEIKRLPISMFDHVGFQTNGRGVLGWIPGSNSLWLAAAHRLQGTPFFWLEPDAAPLRAGWLDEIERAYVACKKPYMGTLIQHSMDGWPNPYMEGVAVYGPQAYSELSAAVNQTESWTKTTAQAVVPRCENTPLIHHIWGENDTPPMFGTASVAGSRVFGLDKIRPEAVVFHRNKDGTLIRTLKHKLGITTPTSTDSEVTFGHGGDVGDLIYGLCAIKAYGGGRLVLFPHAVREAFTEEKAARIFPLIDQQKYITDFAFINCPMTPNLSPDKPKEVDINLNGFRNIQFSRRHNGLWENISETHLRLLGLPLEHANGAAWLTVDKPEPVAGKPVVINRTERYNNHAFPWQKIVQRYQNKIAFVGSPREHRQFQRQFGNVHYHPTPDLLDLARVIAGAKLFIGNQSTPYAIAEGLKVQSILECASDVPDCIFNRPNLQVVRGADIMLPNV